MPNHPLIDRLNETIDDTKLSMQEKNIRALCTIRRINNANIQEIQRLRKRNLPLTSAQLISFDSKIFDESPLRNAATYGYTKIARALIANGADPDSKDEMMKS